jgi:hypothetical protein
MGKWPCDDALHGPSSKPLENQQHRSAKLLLFIGVVSPHTELDVARAPRLRRRSGHFDSKPIVALAFVSHNRGDRTVCLLSSTHEPEQKRGSV